MSIQNKKMVFALSIFKLCERKVFFLPKEYIHFIRDVIYFPRNNLTLEDLSIRCIQMNPESAPSISYLSMYLDIQMGGDFDLNVIQRCCTNFNESDEESSMSEDSTEELESSEDSESEQSDLESNLKRKSNFIGVIDRGKEDARGFC